MKKFLTLILIHQHPKILLGMKKRGFGEGKWNGFGGKVKEDETVEEAARRELQEEVGIEVDFLEKVGILDFEFKEDPDILQVHVFKADNFFGEPTESEEMRPQWWHVDDIPFDEMWPDDIHWIPLLLDGKKFIGRFLFDSSDTIIEQELNETEML